MSDTSQPCGVVFLDKPKGWTSRQAVNHVIRVFAKPEQRNRKQRPKAGHAGTLDPLATGMLPILIGEATRFAGMGLNAEKTYEVTLDLSFQTDTLDLEGEVVARFTDTLPDKADIMAVLPQFSGVVKQVPPVFSAIRLAGKRAHTLARQGEQVDMPVREVEIKQLDWINLEGSKLTLRVVCSKGTYIRSLARDIGETLGCGGCVTALRRLSSGGWPEQIMVSADELEEKKEACIIPLQVWLRDLTQVRLSRSYAKRFVQGQRLRLPLSCGESRSCCVVCENDMLGTAEYDEQKQVLRPVRVLASAQHIWQS